MFSFLKDDQYKLGAYISSLLLILAGILIISFSLFFYYKDLDMAKQGYQLVSIPGQQSTVYQKSCEK